MTIDVCTFIPLQLIIPGSNDFAVYQTQSPVPGVERDITSELAKEGDVFLDRNMEIKITRLSGLKIEVVTRSGMYFNLGWHYWSTGDIWYSNFDIWVPLTLVSSSRGLIGTAIKPDNNCKYHILHIIRPWAIPTGQL